MKTNHTDQEIKDLLRKNPEQAIDVLFRQYFAYVCTIAFKFIPDAQVAEDLAQDLFFDLWKKQQGLNFTGSIKAYLRRAIINRSMNFIRDKKPEIFGESNQPERASSTSTASLAETGELQEQIDQAIDSLPERCRIVFMLSRFDDMTYKEIAKTLDISEKTVENQIVKALKLLRAYLGPYLSIILPILIIIL